MGLGGTLGKIGLGAAGLFTGGATWPLLLAGAGAGIGGDLLAHHLAGGGDKKTAQPAAGTTDPYTDLLQKQAAGAQAEGAASSSAGTDAIAPVMKYLQSILGGDPQAMLAATQPERGRVIDQYDTARRNAAEFGPRGGGTTGALAKSRFDQASSLSDITSSTRRDAAATEGQLGLQLKSLGLSAEQLASTDLNSIINAILNKQYLDVQKRGQNAGLLGDVGSAAGSIISAIITKGGA